MTEVAKLIADMVRAGVDPELIGRAAAALAEREPVRIVDEQAERRRAADRDRKRLRKSAESAERVEAVSPKKESSPIPPKEKTTPSQSEPDGSSKTPRQALESVLDTARAGQVLEHRQRIRKPLTVRAAELLAGQFAECPDPNAAADAMILNGWQGFKPEWLDRQRARGSPSQPQPRYDPFKALEQELDDGQDRSKGSDRRDWDDAQGVPILTIEHHR